MPEPQRITSRNNPLLVKVRKLAHDPGAYRKLGQIWIEGDHLCDAAVAHGASAIQALVAESAWHAHGVQALARSAARVALLPDTLFDSISALDSPARIGFVIAHDTPPVLRPGVPSVVLDRVQDPGNVGSIVRSAAALGVRQLIALEGTAALWSPKALRAGMGAHFALSLLEGLPTDALDALALPLLATSSHAEQALREASLPHPCAWVFGHEGQGVHPELAARCALSVRIPQPGGQESLNVAAAAAICLYESSLAGRGREADPPR
jgi:TrmH family RNA methyltransferase